jgi:hypothetical protein
MLIHHALEVKKETQLELEVRSAGSDNCSRRLIDGQKKKVEELRAHFKISSPGKQPDLTKKWSKRLWRRSLQSMAMRKARGQLFL